MSFLFRYLRFHDIIGGIHVPVDDGVDKLNRKYTLLVFLFLALPIFTKQYIGDPIECFAPVYFAEHQSRYINSYCWTQSTYYMVPVGDPEDDGDQQEPPDRIMPDEVDYFIGFETVTHIGNERLRRVRVSYYQWAPLILLVQGLCFYIPFLIWNSCANNAGVKLRRLLKKASDIASLPPGCQQREALLAEFVDQFHTLVTGEAGWCADLQCGTGASSGGSSASSESSNSSNSQVSAPAGGRGAGAGAGAGPAAGGGGGRSARDQDDDRHHRGGGGHHHQQANGCCLVSIPVIGSLLACCLKPCSAFGLVGPSKYLCLLYLTVKAAYVFNVGLQFFLLGQFLGRGYLKHGLELINRLIVNGDWWASPRFPLSTLCQVRADMSGGLRSYTCQCVLPINVFNEKIFSVVWFYMAFLMPLNVLSLLFWIYRTFETNRLSYIRLCLWRTRLVELNQIHRTVRRLSQSYLGWDGVFLLRLIEHNHGSIMATLIMSRLWEFYANQMKLQEDANQLALANNAQHTLSNTTTAISSQHQLLAAAAAAAAAANQLGPPGGGAGGVGAHHHGGPGGHHHGPPLMPAPAHGNHFGGQQHGAAHGGHGHAHLHGPHPGGGPQHFGPPGVQAGAGQGQPMAPMVPLGPQAHHSGQISQPGHHPLHAANTHHAGHHHGPPAGAHLASAFAASQQASNASLLAQLQHAQHHQQQHHQAQQQQQHQHQHHQQQAANGGSQQQTASGATQQSLSAGQSHGAGASTQQPAPGNVAAAVAALAAAAAANSTNQSAPGTLTTSGNSTTATAAGQAGQSGQQSAPPATVATGTGGGGQSQAPATHNQIHLQSLMQTQQQVASSQAGAASQQAVSSSSSSPATSASQQQQQSAAASLLAGLASATATSAAAAAAAGQQAANSSSATTSFITSASSAAAGGQQQPSGPPLPPPPPAHVVAAVAAAASSVAPGGGAPNQQQLALGNNSGGPGMARTGAGLGVAAALARQQVAAGPAQPPGIGAGSVGVVVAGGQQHQHQHPQPQLAPHANPLMFNMKSSSIQAATNGTRYAPHNINKR